MTVACHKRRPYSSEAVAQSVIFNMRAKGKDTERLKPYQCTHCQRWHLGHKPKVRVAQTAAWLPYAE